MSVPSSERSSHWTRDGRFHVGVLEDCRDCPDRPDEREPRTS